MHLSILAGNGGIESLYCNHSTYHEGDSGLDLFFIEEINIGAKTTKLVSLGIKCEAYPDKDKESNISYYLYPRSSIYKTPLRMANSVGIIDAGYRGTIMAAIDNISDEDYTIKVGQRLFQFCSPTLAPITFELTDRLSDTTRGDGGFGSTNQ
jgi:dUTP pyrophosphatase